MIDIAIDAAKKAGNIALNQNKYKPKISYKSDNSIVTEADLEAEKLIRDIILKKFPNHGIIGEEFPESNPGAKYKWIIDPIDGTADYARQIPFWSTMIAVLEDNIPIIGVIYFPGQDELYSAEKGKGAYFNGKKTKVSTVTNLDHAYITSGSIGSFNRLGKVNSFIKLATKVKGRKNFGSYSNALAFQGKVDASIDARGGIYDFAPPAIIVEEAGGTYSDMDGKKSIENGNFVISNKHIHKQVIKILNSKS